MVGLQNSPPNRSNAASLIETHLLSATNGAYDEKNFKKMSQNEFRAKLKTATMRYYNVNISVEIILLFPLDL